MVYLGNDEQRFGECLDAQLGLALHVLAVFVESHTAGNFERAGSRDHCLVIVDVFDCSEAVPGGFLDHGDGVLVGALDENGARAGVSHSLDERVLFLAQNMFLNCVSVAQVAQLEFLH